MTVAAFCSGCITTTVGVPMADHGLLRVGSEYLKERFGNAVADPELAIVWAKCPSNATQPADSTTVAVGVLRNIPNSAFRKDYSGHVMRFRVDTLRLRPGEALSSKGLAANAYKRIGSDRHAAAVLDKAIQDRSGYKILEQTDAFF